MEHMEMTSPEMDMATCFERQKLSLRSSIQLLCFSNVANQRENDLPKFDTSMTDPLKNYISDCPQEEISYSEPRKWLQSTKNI